MQGIAQTQYKYKRHRIFKSNQYFIGNMTVLPIQISILKGLISI